MPRSCSAALSARASVSSAIAVRTRLARRARPTGRRGRPPSSHAPWRGAAQRHARVAVYLDPDQSLKRSTRLDVPLADYVEEAIARFVGRNFAAGSPVPEVHVDRRVYEAESYWENGAPKVSLHAKCLVVDDARALVTSANFTGRGEKRNVEAGVLVRDVGFAKSLAGQFRRLSSLGAMVRVR